MLRRISRLPTSLAATRLQTIRKIQCRIPDREYLEITGKDTTKFLQGICTNDITKLEGNNTSIAAAFLTTKGRILADAILYNVIDKETTKRTVVIETHKCMTQELQKYLTMYRLRSNVKIAMGGYSTLLVPPTIKTMVNNGSLNEDLVACVVDDPRSPTLDATRILMKGINTNTNELDTLKHQNLYLVWRLMNGLAEGPGMAVSSRTLTLVLLLLYSHYSYPLYSHSNSSTIHTLSY